MIFAWVAIAPSVLGIACSEEPVAVPAPRAEPAPPEPEIPGFDALTDPQPGRGEVVLPTWNADDIRFEHPIRQLAAKLGRSRMVSQVLLGEDAETGVMVTFYGEGFLPGSYPVLPATDETRAAHAGHDSKVTTVVQGVGGSRYLHSKAGMLTIEAADDGSITGRLEATVESQANLRETTIRARFVATPEQWLNAQLEHQEAIRDQLRNKGRGRMRRGHDRTTR